ncbi:putative U-box domain-containing protein 13-like [Sesbania bispinosa]|nr:putative U-box domain-containing protein 13-like [Sesbania bispinosa]
MRALRSTQANVNAENEELKIDMDLEDDNVDPPPSPEPQVQVEDETTGDEEDGEAIIYDTDFDLDQPILLDVLANKEVANVHSRVNFTRHLKVGEQQCLQQATFMKYLRGTIVPHLQGVQSSNEELEKQVTRLKAFVELVGKEMKAFKEQYESEKVAKDWAEKSKNLMSGKSCFH